MGSRVIALLIFNLDARRGWVVSTTPRPLYRQGKGPILEDVGWASGSVWTVMEKRQ
jgi:hypothetical protein